MAVASAGKKKRPDLTLRCGADHEGIPRLYFGDEGSVGLPSNVDVVAWAGDHVAGNPIVASCPATDPPRDSSAPTIHVAWESGRDLRELMDQVILPAALTNPGIIFSIWTGRGWYAEEEESGRLGAGAYRAVEVSIDGPDWGPYQGAHGTGPAGDRIRLLFVSQSAQTLGRVGYHDNFASVMDAGFWVQRGITAIKEAHAFDWAGNGVRVTGSCDFLVGANFLPDPADFGTTAIEAPTLAEVLAIPGNSAWGYVDYMLTNADLSSAANLKMKADQIARNIMGSKSGLGLNYEGDCPLPAFNTGGWSSGMLLMRDWLADRIGRWASFESGGIPWEPQNPAGENP